MLKVSGERTLLDECVEISSQMSQSQPDSIIYESNKRDSDETRACLLIFTTFTTVCKTTGIPYYVHAYIYCTC